MKVYLVGGAVRDELLGISGADRDWVVVGATPQDLLNMGYQAVGKDFPVFLHPQTKEEYALARTERKIAKGYHGFEVHASPDVTLEEDLSRRDLTINAIAKDEAGVLHDPYGGQADLKNQLFSHVTDAFAEDPVRILRVARLAARFTTFTVAATTLQLMQHMVNVGEVDSLVSERVWQELARGLMSTKPSRMLEVLRSCGALERILPELDRLYGVPQTETHHPEIDTGIHIGMVLDISAQLQTPLEVRFACLVRDLGKGITPADQLPRHIGHEQRSVKLLKQLCERLRVPQHCKELAEVIAREHGNIHQSQNLGAQAVLRLLVRCDAIRRPDRFELILQACECDARGRLGLEKKIYSQSVRLTRLLQVVLQVDTKVIANQAIKEGLSGEAIGKKIEKERERVLEIEISQL
ncbi:MAG: multifunctional CCA addition/repair protein [Betaproteobacteria bacterium]|jgi:tRNA nucleotidyltransferase (CCA-adding enzyme)|nr:multifunctional CCA addition/repair protein [Betaproteobacteria bacterium]NBT67473.1 multifunctional CCA addition/repair protein [Betaproteobacteria bacterium]NBY07544.1 multifunctional CCA addition/repair protein [Betaproteobacteria bacterium]